MRRFLPPLLLVLIVGLVAWRTSARPERGVEQERIEARWEQTDAVAREQLATQADQYLSSFSSEDDRRFAAHAFLRARRLDKALQARWHDLERDHPVEEVKAFAKEALIAFGWDDEARTIPSVQNPQATLALIEGGDERTKAWLEKLIATGPIDELYSIMRRSVRLRSKPVRDLLGPACRARSVAEARDGVPDAEWAMAAALLSFRREPYPEREEDLKRLLAFLGGPARLSANPRWVLTCRELGDSEDPRALEALESQITLLEGSSAVADKRDVGTLQLSLLGGGVWKYSPKIKELFAQNDPNLRLLKTFCPEVLVDRWHRGDERALFILHNLLGNEALDDSSLRELICRGLLHGGPMPTEAVKVEEILASLEAPGAPANLKAQALAFRLRRGEPGARTALVRWLAYDPDVLKTHKGKLELASSHLMTGLRALYLYD